MVRDATATRARIFAAASDEFARYGIAGARMDRIASSARANKAQIYEYFGAKEVLFDMVLEHELLRLISELATPDAPQEIAEFVGRAFDYIGRPFILGAILYRASWDVKLFTGSDLCVCKEL
jgi:AcrR family transcriptional regulator